MGMGMETVTGGAVNDGAELGAEPGAVLALVELELELAADPAVLGVVGVGGPDDAADSKPIVGVLADAECVRTGLESGTSGDVKEPEWKWPCERGADSGANCVREMRRRGLSSAAPDASDALPALAPPGLCT